MGGSFDPRAVSGTYAEGFMLVIALGIKRVGGQVNAG